MIAALLQVDRAAAERWLSFPRPPPSAVRQALLAAGWRCDGHLRSWRHDDLCAEIPPCVTIGLGGDCDYSTLCRGVAAPRPVPSHNYAAAHPSRGAA
jgi:hypothetical protein